MTHKYDSHKTGIHRPSHGIGLSWSDPLENIWSWSGWIQLFSVLVNPNRSFRVLPVRWSLTQRSLWISDEPRKTVFQDFRIISERKKESRIKVKNRCAQVALISSLVFLTTTEQIFIHGNLKRCISVFLKLDNWAQTRILNGYLVTDTWFRS